VLACRELIWGAASEFLGRRVDVILDDGFFLRDDRVRYAELSNRTGAGTTIHFMDTPIGVVRARLEARNARLPPYNFYIDPGTLQGFLGLFEAPSDDEGAALVVVQSVTPWTAPGLT
jgi:predicted kinase